MPGGALNFFLGGCVPRGFQNVGSRERIFLKKNGGLGNENLENFGSRELGFWPKHGWKCKNFLKIENGGHKSGALTVNWWARERRLAWKKGIMTAAHPHTPFQCECPPRASTVLPTCSSLSNTAPYETYVQPVRGIWMCMYSFDNYEPAQGHEQEGSFKG